MESLKDKIVKVLSKPYKKMLQVDKCSEENSVKFLHPDSYYRRLVYNNFSEDALDTLDLTLVLVTDNKELEDIWLALKTLTTTMAYGNVKGLRQLKYLLYDKNSNKYLGVLGLRSDLIHCKNRDNYIGWSYEDRLKKKRLNYIMNISCCIGLRPASYNFNIGKLIASLAFSERVQDDYYSKYGDYIAAFTTMGLNGKSVQYDRLKCLKFCGYTVGMGKTLPEELYQEGMIHLKDEGYNLRGKRMIDKLQLLFKELGLDRSLVKHNQKRSIYVGFTGENCQQFLKGDRDDFTIECKTVNEIINWWKERWARKRYNHLKNQGRLLKDIELYRNTLRKEQKLKAVIKFNNMKMRKLGEVKFKEQQQMKYRLKKYTSFINTATKVEVNYKSGIINMNYLKTLYKTKGYNLIVNDQELVVLQTDYTIGNNIISLINGIMYHQGHKAIVCIEDQDLVKTIKKNIKLFGDDAAISIIDNTIKLNIKKKNNKIIGTKVVLLYPEVDQLVNYFNKGSKKKKGTFQIGHKSIYNHLKHLVKLSLNKPKIQSLINLIEHIITKGSVKCSEEEHEIRKQSLEEFNSHIVK